MTLLVKVAPTIHIEKKQFLRHFFPINYALIMKMSVSWLFLCLLL